MITNERYLIAINLAIDALSGIRHDAAVGAANSWIARSATTAINEIRRVLKEKENA